MPQSDRYTYTARVLKAMAHPTRLFILDQLKQSEHCVCELQELIGSDMSTVSRHLSVLREAGIISNRRHNNNIYYRIERPCVLDVYTCIMSREGSQSHE